MLSVAALTVQSVNLEHRFIKQKQRLIDVEQKMLVSSSPVLSAQHSIVVSAGEARKCRKKRDDAEQ